MLCGLVEKEEEGRGEGSQKKDAFGSDLIGMRMEQDDSIVLHLLRVDHSLHRNGWSLCICVHRLDRDLFLVISDRLKGFVVFFLYYYHVRERKEEIVSIHFVSRSLLPSMW